MFDFIWYCIDCMLTCFMALGGKLPEDFTWKDGFVGIATLAVFMILAFLIVWIIVAIKNKK